MRFVLLACLFACGAVSGFMPTNPPPHALAPKSESDVELFTSGQPAREFVEIGIVEAAPKSGVSGAGDLDVLAQLRREAALHGCDGVIVNDTSKNIVGFGSAGGTMQTSYRAACIVYK